MQPLAARHTQERLQLQLRQQLTNIVGRTFDLGERHVRARVEIEDHPVGHIRAVGMRAPGMEFQRIELHQLQQAGCVFDHQVIRIGAGLFGQFDRAHTLEAGGVVLLEETRFFGAAGAANDGQRASHDLRQQVIHHRLVVVPDIALGRADIRVDQLGRAGQRRQRSRGRCGNRRFARRRCCPRRCTFRYLGCRVFGSTCFCRTLGRRRSRPAISGIAVGQIGNAFIRTQRLERCLAQ